MVGHQKHTPTFTDLIPLTSADTISKEDYHRNRIIYIFVDRVLDGTRFQGRHVSGYRVYKRKFSPLTGGDLADKTIQVKLYAIKCPTFTGGEDNQPEQFASEAKHFVEDLILHRVVRIKLLKKENNNFAVCQVETSKEACCFCLCRKPKKDISQELAKAGFARVYTGGATVSDSYREFLEAIVQEARDARLGLWSLDENVLSPEALRKKQKRQRSMRKLLSVKSLQVDADDELNGVSSHHDKSIDGTSSHRKNRRDGLGGKKKSKRTLSMDSNHGSELSDSGRGDSGHNRKKKSDGNKSDYDSGSEDEMNPNSGRRRGKKKKKKKKDRFDDAASVDSFADE